MGYHNRYTRKTHKIKGGDLKHDLQTKITTGIDALNSELNKCTNFKDYNELFNKMNEKSIGQKFSNFLNKTRKNVTDLGNNMSRIGKDVYNKSKYTARLIGDTSNIDKIHLKNQFYVQFMDMESVRKVYADVPFDTNTEFKKLYTEIKDEKYVVKIKGLIETNGILNVKRETIQIEPTIIGKSFKLIDTIKYDTNEKHTVVWFINKIDTENAKLKDFIYSIKNNTETNIPANIKSKFRLIKECLIIKEQLEKELENKDNVTNIKEIEDRPLQYDVKETKTEEQLQQEQVTNLIDNTDPTQFALGFLKTQNFKYNESEWVPDSINKINRAVYEVSFSNLNNKQLIERALYEEIKNTLIDEIIFCLDLGSDLPNQDKYKKTQIQETITKLKSEEEVKVKKNQNNKIRSKYLAKDITQEFILDRLKQLRYLYSNYVYFKEKYDCLYKYVHTYRFLINNALWNSGLSLKSIFAIDYFNEKVFRCIKENGQVSMKYKNSLMSIFIMLLPALSHK